MRHLVRRALAAWRDAPVRLFGRATLQWRGLQGARRFPPAAEDLLAGWRTAAAPTHAHYEGLFRYFVTGFAVRRSRLGAHADYAGMMSYNGPAADRLEGFSRMAPLLAAWLHGQRPQRVLLAEGTPVDLVELLTTGVLAGTDPASDEYWGDIRHWGQAIVEAADIALALWLAREQVWARFTRDERTRVARWLAQVNGKNIPDNNWHLFVVQVNAVLAALGEPHDDAAMEQHYQRAKSFHRGAGWFRDGERAEEPGFDYYNAWGFHYHLQWLRRMAPDLDPAFIDTALREFVGVYRHFIGPVGLPMLGRSACYRMAAPAPLLLAQATQPTVIAPGEARRALDAVWQYFLRRGAVRGGNVTQGYFGPDRRLLEDYSGPASCLWSLRSLVAAFALPEEHALWQAEPTPLPVERGDYRIPIAVLGWTVAGDRASGAITVETGQSGDPPLQDAGAFDRLRGLFTRLPRRPKNTAAKYERSSYDSRSPYGLRDEPPA